jgi:hypothetical protein
VLAVLAMAATAFYQYQRQWTFLQQAYLKNLHQHGAVVAEERALPDPNEYDVQPPVPKRACTS